MLWVRSALGAAVFTAIGFSSAAAEPVTKYVHYPVTGTSIGELYAAMLRRGPHVGRGRAFASVRMDPKISSTTRATGGSCQIDSFTFDMTFTIQLPELVQPSSVEPLSRASFNEFYQFAKKHEETHRTIWITCAEKAEALVVKTEAKSCPAAETQSLKIVEGVARNCDARHTAFDIAEQVRLASHPFMKEVRFDQARLRNASAQLTPAEKTLITTGASKSEISN